MLSELLSGWVLSPGNSKMSIPTFTLPTGKTCVGKTMLCSKYCYGKMPERLSETVRNHREKMFQLTLRNDFVDIMIKEVSKQKVPYVRIHESGDLYSQEYLWKWYKIADACKGVTFLTFTKNFLLDFDGRPENFNLYLSIFPDTICLHDAGMPFAYTIFNGIKALKTYWRSVPSGFVCPGKCDSCMWCFSKFEGSKDVIFPMRIANTKAKISRDQNKEYHTKGIINEGIASKKTREGWKSFNKYKERRAKCHSQ